MSVLLPLGLTKVPYGFRVYLDATSAPSGPALHDPSFIDQLANWLNAEQPIPLAINGDSAADGYPLASALFEQTALVVYSVGAPGNPALTCQARPQEAEVFGEFPPRHELGLYTKFPVVVPSATPGYSAHYTDGHLEVEAGRGTVVCGVPVTAFADDPRTRGYLSIMVEYFEEACRPREGHGTTRTALWGLQRPPLDRGETVIRLGPDTTFDAAGLHIFPFFATNAAAQVSLSIDPDCLAEVFDRLLRATESLAIRAVHENETQLASRFAADRLWNVVRPSGVHEYPLIAHFVSTLFPLGHIKSAKPADSEFVKHFMLSPKWLKLREL